MSTAGIDTRTREENVAWLLRNATSAKISTRQHANDMHTSGENTRPADIGYRKLMTFCLHAKKKPNPTATRMSIFPVSFSTIRVPPHQPNTEQ